ncbi:MAG: outer membrane beta-barrel protein [Calditrichae bacterium]|nr:outer membrane beta-barrel protein [Calditrichota bacterium]MCB9059442.1 outer membrane beta-barrel protein [Calditrichia bacterium]
MKRNLFIGIMLLALSCNAQLLADIETTSSKPAFSIGLDGTFNNDDLQLGIYPGAHWKNLELRAAVFFMTRPYEKKVYIRQTSSFQIRYLEWRSLLGFQVEKRMDLYNDTGFSVGAGYGYSFGTYAGSDKSAEDNWIPVFKAGIEQRFGSIFVGVGYKYIDIPHVDSNLFYLSIVY